MSLKKIHYANQGKLGLNLIILLVHQPNIKNLGHARYFSVFMILLRKARLSAQYLLSANVPEQRPLTSKLKLADYSLSQVSLDKLYISITSVQQSYVPLSLVLALLIHLLS